MKLYLLVVLVLFMVVGIFGFIGPMFISAKSTEAVILGVILLIASVPVFYYFIKQIIKGFKK